MARGISQVAAVGGVVSLVVRNRRDGIIAQLTVPSWAYESWMADWLWEWLNRADPPSRIDDQIRLPSRGSLALVPEASAE